MNATPIIRALVLSASVLALTVGSSFAQQITGTPGSPSATTTIDGKYLPPPPRRLAERSIWMRWNGQQVQRVVLGRKIAP